VIIASVASGTSADGLDVAVVDLRLGQEGGVLEARLLHSRTVPWPSGVREQVLATLPPARVAVADWCALEQAVGQAAAAAVADLLEDTGVAAELVVSPGQTVFHDVRDGRCLGTLQIGQPAWIAERTGLPVVSDLRARDVAAGGHGAPLASTLDALWLASSDETAPPRAALNLGGIANVTVVGSDAQPVLAWDTGPANCLLDVAVERVTGGVQQHDVDGRMARAGVVRQDLLTRLLAHPHYTATPPVSTGREVFSAAYLDAVLAEVGQVDAHDLLATLTELTAVTVAHAVRPFGLVEVIASGGGTRNPALMDALRTRLGDTALVTSDDRGLPSDAKEVVLWALLGFLTWHGLAGSTPATGAPQPRILGRIIPGAGPLMLPPPAAAAPTRLQFRAPALRRAS
jgi:anhydro-N-acetylmuramic acid kinase